MKKTKIPASKTRRFFAYLIDSLIIDLIIVYPLYNIICIYIREYDLLFCKYK